MSDLLPEEVHIHYAGFKPDHSTFSNDEILALNISFMRWAESENIRVGGGIGPYPDNDERDQQLLAEIAKLLRQERQHASP